VKVKDMIDAEIGLETKGIAGFNWLQEGFQFSGEEE
jgi:hypothetical protein